LQCLLVVVLVGRVLHDDGVIPFADFSSLLGFGFSLLRDLDFLRRRLRLGDELLQVVLQDTRHQLDYSKAIGTQLGGTTTYLLWRARSRVLCNRARHVRWHVLEDARQPVDNVLVVDFTSLRDVSPSPVYSKPRASRAISGCTLRFMKLKATCSALSPASLSTLMRASSSGS
jgi:hypothetical protein